MDLLHWSRRQCQRWPIFAAKGRGEKEKEVFCALAPLKPRHRIPIRSELGAHEHHEDNPLYLYNLLDNLLLIEN